MAIPQVCQQPIAQYVTPGPQGPRGASLYSGTAAPASGTGSNGDYYLNTLTGDLYYKASGSWGLQCNLKGPAGIRFLGDWVSGTAYIETDMVRYDGEVFFCAEAVTGTTTPDLDPHWVDLGANAAIAAPLFQTLDQGCNVFKSATDADGTDLSANLITDAPVPVGVQGLTVRNVLGELGGFKVDSNGNGVADGWAVLSNQGGIGTWVVGAQTLSDAGSGSGTNSLNTPARTIPGHKYFAHGVFTTTGQTSKFEVGFGTNTGAMSPTNDTGFVLSVTDDPVSEAHIGGILEDVNAYGVFAVASRCIGGITDSVTVEKFALIDLTAHWGAGKEPTEAECLQMFPYFENTKSIQPQSIKATGKNLVNESTFEPNKFVSVVDGEFRDEPTGYLRIGHIAVNPAYEYSIAAWNFEGTITVCMYDADKNYLGYVGNREGTPNFTLPSDCHYIAIRIGATITDFSAVQVMLNIGSTALPYEPYHEDVLDLSSVGELRKVPSARDEITKEGKLIRRVAEYTLTEDDVDSLATSPVNVDWVLINKPADYIGYGELSGCEDAYVFGDYEHYNSGGHDNTDNVGLISSSGDASRFILIVAKGTYTDTAEAKTALAGTVVRYELAEPVITDLEALPLLTVENGGQVIVTETNGLPVPTSIEYPTNLTGSVDQVVRQAQDNRRQIDDHETRLSKLDDDASTTTIEQDTNVFPTGENLVLDPMSLAKVGGSGLTMTNLLGEAGKGDDATGWGSAVATDGEWLYNTAQVDEMVEFGRIVSGIQEGHSYQFKAIGKSVATTDVCKFMGVFKDSEGSTVGTAITLLNLLDTGNVDVVGHDIAVAPTNAVSMNIYPLATGSNNIYLKELQVVDLTQAFGAGNEPPAAWCLANLPYIENTVSVRDPVVKSCGKNLFDLQDRRDGGIYNALTGAWYADTDFYSSGLIPCISGQSYITNRGKPSHFSCYDASGQYIGGKISVIGSSFVAIDGAQFFRVHCAYEDQDPEVFIVNIGSTALPYEPYQSDSVRCPGPLRRLPNGVEDTLNDDGTITRRVGQHVLTEDDITDFVTAAWVNIDRAPFTVPGCVAMTGWDSSRIDGAVAIQGWPETVMADDPANAGKILLSGTSGTNFLIAKDTYASLAAAKTALAGTEVLYQLATPTIEPAIPNTVTVYEGGQISIEQVYEGEQAYGTGLMFDEALREISECYRYDDGEKINVITTLASDGLSATISGATADEVYHIEGPYKWQIPVPTSLVYPTNREGVLDATAHRTGQNAREIEQLKEDIAVLVLMIAGVIV